MQIPDSRDVPVPVHYCANMEDFVVRGGSRAGALYQAVGIDPALIVANGSVTMSQFRRLLHETVRLSGDPACMLAIGAAMTPASHGALGIAVLSSATVREAVRTLARYFRTRSPLVLVEANLDGDLADIRVATTLPGSAEHRLLMELVTSTIANALHALTLGRIQGAESCFDFPAPPHAARYASLLHMPARFQADHTGIRFPARWLDTPLPFADETARRNAIAQCRRELDDLERRTDLRERVRARLLSGVTQMPDCAQVARELHVSERTLRRQLAALDSSFQSILNDTRRQLAMHYLRETGLTIAEIAERLGYSDPSNFGNAFRQWTGHSPRTWRRTPADEDS